MLEVNLSVQYYAETMYPYTNYLYGITTGKPSWDGNFLKNIFPGTLVCMLHPNIYIFPSSPCLFTSHNITICVHEILHWGQSMGIKSLIMSETNWYCCQHLNNNV